MPRRSARPGNGEGAPGRDRPARARSRARATDFWSVGSVTRALCHNGRAGCYSLVVCFGVPRGHVSPALEERAAIGIIEFPVAILIGAPIGIVGPVIAARGVALGVGGLRPASDLFHDGAAELP